MFGPKIKMEKDLFERCKKHAIESGYSSVEEFITHALEKELKGLVKKREGDRKEVEKQLKGLGYID